MISNNPKRASFRQRIGVYLDILRDKRLELGSSFVSAAFMAVGAIYAKSKRGYSNL